MIEVKELSFSIKNKQILNSVDLRLSDNGIHVILGPSGCGKTTLLRLISGLEKPTDGKILKDGQDITTQLRSTVGFVFQNLALWPHMSVEKHLHFMLDGGKKQNANSVDSALKIVNLSDRKKSYPHELSGGEKQRLAIARALVHSPELLLMDEPFSNLDVLLRADLSQILRELVRTTNLTILYVTHNIYEALELADTIILFTADKEQTILDKETLSNMSHEEIINLYKEKQHA